MIWYVIAFSWFDEWVKSLKCIIFSAHDLHSVLNTMGQQSLLNHISILAQAVLCLHSSLTTWFINNRVWLIFMLVLNHTCNNTVFCLHSLKKPRKQRTAACMFVISQDMKKKFSFEYHFFLNSEDILVLIRLSNFCPKKLILKFTAPLPTWNKHSTFFKKLHQHLG